MKNKTTLAHIGIFIANFIYAANYTVAKEVMPAYIQPFGFIVLRVLAGMSLFWLFHTLFVREKVEREDWVRLALCGLFGVAINMLCFFKGLAWTTPINAGLMMTTTPILVLLTSAFVLGEKITQRKIFGIGLGLAGAILLISYGQKVAFGGEGFWGDLLVLINALSYGIYLVLVKKLMKKYHPITIIKWVFTFGFIYVLPFGWSDIQLIEWGTFPMSIWLAFGFVLFFVTFLTYLLNATALKIVNPSVVSIYIYLQPLIATLIALSFGKDELTGVKIISGILICLGVYLVSSKGKLEVESELLSRMK